jgi:hypothetical protein
MRSFFLAFTLVISSILSATDTVKTYPTHWWVGMKNPQLQVMLQAPEIGKKTKVTVHYAGVKINKVHSPENSNYLFIDLLISPITKPGILQLQCQDPVT